MLPIALALAAALTAAPADDAPECLAILEDGSTFPTCFDPGEGLEVGVGVGAGTSLELRVGILFRTARASRSRKGTLWLTEHRLLQTRAQPIDPRREVTATLYEGTFRRHLREGFILVPSPRPIRLPFPFDVALQARLGTLERRVFEGPGLKLEVGRAALMLDPVRSESGRFHAAVGPAMSYTVRTDGEAWVHELSPFTSGVLDLGAESADGWWRARAQGIAGWVTIPGTGTFFRASGQLDVERLVFALNDQPIWLYLTVRAAQRDAGLFRASEVVGSAGLVMRAFQ